MERIEFNGKDNCPLYAVSINRRASTDQLPVVLLHGGGPDHQSLIPLALELSDYHVILPDIRGYGRSVCVVPASHTWSQYADDVITLLDHLGLPNAVVGGAGIGSTICLRMALAYPDRVKALVLISVEDIEDDEAKKKEIEFMQAFADRVRASGIEAAWEPILKELSPIIESMVREAIPRSNPMSIAAAAAIGNDRSFRNIEELSAITCPTLIIPGMDWRHPRALAEKLAGLLPKGKLATVSISKELRNSQDFAEAFAPTIREFLTQNFRRYVS